MSLLVLLRVSVDETIYTGSTKGSSCDALALCTSPWTRNIAATEGFHSTGNDGGFGGLLPLLGLSATTAAAARPRAMAAVSAITVVSVSVAVIAAVVSSAA